MTYIKALHHSSQFRTTSCRHHFLLHMLGHSQANLICVKLTLCHPPIGYVFTSFSIELYSLLWALPCSAKSILNTGWLCLDKLQSPQWMDSCSWVRGNQSSTSLLKRWAHSLRSMKQSRIGSTKASRNKNVIHCVPVIKRLCPGVSWKVFN